MKTADENKILLDKIEHLKKEKKMFSQWVNKLQCENDELKHRLKYKIFEGLEDKDWIK
jgi:hypothetical protein